MELLLSFTILSTAFKEYIILPCLTYGLDLAPGSMIILRLVASSFHNQQFSWTSQLLAVEVLAHDLFAIQCLVAAIKRIIIWMADKKEIRKTKNWNGDRPTGVSLLLHHHPTSASINCVSPC